MITKPLTEATKLVRGSKEGARKKEAEPKWWKDNGDTSLALQ